MYEAIYQIAREYDDVRSANSAETWRLECLLNGEIREGKTLEIILRSLVRDHGFYLRRVKT